MKCPSCATNHKKSEGQRCRCGYTFVFNPAVDRRMTDGKMLAAIRMASANDTWFFTRNQLLNALTRVRRVQVGPPILWLVGAIIAAACSVAVLLSTGLMSAWPAILGFGGVAAVLFIVFRSAVNPPAPDPEEFDSVLGKWQGAGNAVDRLLTETGLHDPPPNFEQDVYDYGVERILIVQHDLLVDLLVRNNLHADQRALVISAKGYPEYLQRRACSLLEESPGLSVFLLHDGASARARPPQWLQPIGSRRVVDLGPTPADMMAIAGVRPMAPRRCQGHLPVDAIPYAVLSSLLAMAFAEGVPLAELLAEKGTFSGVGLGGDFG